MVTDCNKIIGERIRVARVVRDVTQKELADFLGVTFQQSRKYELGLSRISAYRLFLVSKYLKVPLDFFFSPLEERRGSEEASNSTPSFHEDVLPNQREMEFKDVQSLFEKGTEKSCTEQPSQEEMMNLWRKYSTMDSYEKEAVLGLVQRLSERS